MDNKDTNSHPRIGDWVLYKNNQLIAFNKPPTIAVQQDKTGDKTLLNLAEIYTQSSLYLIHRLDRPASGLILLGKTKKALAALNQQFQQRKVKKTYLAIVQNLPPESSGTLVHYLRKNQQKNQSQAFETEEKATKRAELNYRVLGSSDRYHLLEIELITGRHHQIRAQLAAIKCPIKGDVKYGFRRSNRDRSIHLHAWKLGFQHPISKEKVELIAPPPEDVIWQFFSPLLS